MGEDTGREVKEIQALITQAEKVIDKLHRLSKSAEPWQRWRVAQLDRHLRDAKREMGKLIEEISNQIAFADAAKRGDGKSDGKKLG